MKKIKRTLLGSLLLLVASYFIPAKQADFFDLYTKSDVSAKNLKEFKARPTKTVKVDGTQWEYLASGKGKEAILFIHGMGGAYDLWWQQVVAFEKDYRVITYSLPEAINSVEGASKGLLSILKTEDVDDFYVVGTSMGGYIAQYLVQTIPNRIKKVVFGNTFPPNDIIRTKNLTKSKVIPWLPETLISKFANKQLNEKLLPAGNNDALLTAFLPSLPFSKKQFMNRYAVVTDPFIVNTNNYEFQRIPKLIIDSKNDPLVERQLRESLKDLYPKAKVHSFGNVGHFPYINEATAYNVALKQFFDADGDFEQLEETIHHYFEGRKSANINQLKMAFAKEAKLYTTKENVPFVITLSDYFDKVTKEGKKEAKTTILSAEVNGHIAQVKTEFEYSTKTYQDYLTLLKTNEGWKIISKTFTKTK